MERETIASGNFFTTFGREIEARGDYTVAIALNDQNGAVVSQASTMAVMGGRAGIGTVTPTTRLRVVDDVNGSVLSVFNGGNNQSCDGIEVQAGTKEGSRTMEYLLARDDDGDVVGSLPNSSGTFSAVDLSDIKSKTNIRDTEVDALAIIEGLRVVDFNRKSLPEGPSIHGFITQEAQEVFPEMVSELDEDLLGISKDTLIPILTKAIQEQQETVNQLRQRDEEYSRTIQDQQAQIEELRRIMEKM